MAGPWSACSTISPRTASSSTGVSQTTPPSSARACKGRSCCRPASCTCRAEVRSLIHADAPSNHVKALGCLFHWDQEADRDQLEVFLYGSNLQWRMNQLGEQMRTPLQWLAGESRWRRRRSRGGFDRWASMLSRSTASAHFAPEIGLVSVPGGASRDRTLVSYHRFADVAPLRVDVVTRSGIHTLEGPAYFLDSVSAAGTLLHFYRFETRSRSIASRQESRGRRRGSPPMRHSSCRRAAGRRSRRARR